MAATVASIMVALAAPRPIWPRVKLITYMKVAGTSEAYPGPPAVSAMTRSKLLIDKWDKTSTVENTTALEAQLLSGQLDMIAGELGLLVFAGLTQLQQARFFREHVFPQLPSLPAATRDGASE